MAEFDIDLDVDRTGEARLVAGRKSDEKAGKRGSAFRRGAWPTSYTKNVTANAVRQHSIQRCVRDRLQLANAGTKPPC